MSGAQYDEDGVAVDYAPVSQQRAAPEVNNPFAKAQASSINAGTVAIESDRAIAEAQGKLLLAKRFPRDEATAYARVMESCKRPGLALVSAYAYKRGGTQVTGPSIRLAEEMVRCFGNVDYGIRELSRKHGESEMQAYAWDLETNVISTQNFTVRHIRDTQGGGKALTDERDIYEITANMGARRLRARILAILPPDLVDAAVAECRRTRDGGNKLPFIDQVRQMAPTFAKLGVSTDMLIAHLGHPLDETTPDELSELRDIYTTIKDGVAKVGEFFGAKKVEGEVVTGSRLDALQDKIAGQSQPGERGPTADANAARTIPGKKSNTAPVQNDPPFGDGSANDISVNPDLVWLVEQIEGAKDMHALDALLASAAIKVKLKALPPADVRQVEIAELATRRGFKGVA